MTRPQPGGSPASLASTPFLAVLARAPEIGFGASHPELAVAQPCQATHAGSLEVSGSTSVCLVAVGLALCQLDTAGAISRGGLN